MSDEPPRFDPVLVDQLPAELALGQLPPGRHGLPRAFVVRNQRLRLIAAMLRSLPEHGYSGTTIGHLTQEAGVSRAAFYGQFSSKEDCFLAAYDLAGDWLVERVENVLGEKQDVGERVRAGVDEALGVLATNPSLAHLFAIDAIQAGRASRERQRACLVRISEALWRDGGTDPRPPPELDEMLFAGVLATIARYVDAGRVEQLSEASREVVRYLLTPCMNSTEMPCPLEKSA